LPKPEFSVLLAAPSDDELSAKLESEFYQAGIAGFKLGEKFAVVASRTIADSLE